MSGFVRLARNLFGKMVVVIHHHRPDGFKDAFFVCYQYSLLTFQSHLVLIAVLTKELK